MIISQGRSRRRSARLKAAFKDFSNLSEITPAKDSCEVKPTMNTKAISRLTTGNVLLQPEASCGAEIQSLLDFDSKLPWQQDHFGFLPFHYATKGEEAQTLIETLYGGTIRQPAQFWAFIASGHLIRELLCRKTDPNELSVSELIALFREREATASLKFILKRLRYIQDAAGSVDRYQSLNEDVCAWVRRIHTTFMALACFIKQWQAKVTLFGCREAIQWFRQISKLTGSLVIEIDRTKATRQKAAV